MIGSWNSPFRRLSKQSVKLSMEIDAYNASATSWVRPKRFTGNGPHGQSRCGSHSKFRTACHLWEYRRSDLVNGHRSCHRTP